MPSQKILLGKKKIVADLVAEFKAGKSFVFAEARGLTVFQDTGMRADLRKNNVKYSVIKNTTLIIVFKELGIEGVEDYFKGPTAIAFSKDDVVVSAKLMKQYADKYEKLNIKGGVIEGKVATAADINALASIPSKEVLYTQIVCGLISPITKLAMLLNSIAEKTEEAGAATAASVVVSCEKAAE